MGIVDSAVGSAVHHAIRFGMTWHCAYCFLSRRRLVAFMLCLSRARFAGHKGSLKTDEW